MAVIEEGDTLVRLALRLGIPVSVLLQLNPEFATGLTVGAAVRLPGTEPKRVGATVAQPRVLPEKAPTTAGQSFLQDFEAAFGTFLDTIADPRIRKFMLGQSRLLESEFLGRIGRSFLSGEVKDLTEAPDPLAFFKSIDPRERFFAASPFERGEQGFAPTALRPRRVRF